MWSFIGRLWEQIRNSAKGWRFATKAVATTSRTNRTFRLGPGLDVSNGMVRSCQPQVNLYCQQLGPQKSRRQNPVCKASLSYWTEFPVKLREMASSRLVRPSIPGCPKVAKSVPFRGGFIVDESRVARSCRSSSSVATRLATILRSDPLSFSRVLSHSELLLGHTVYLFQSASY